jgi:hypothetical protein
MTAIALTVCPFAVTGASYHRLGEGSPSVLLKEIFLTERKELRGSLLA